uniref:Uncharacterized protein n=1 Tax=Panagrolaimus sp. JU765 TaxID=591449 RepID=A0AC34QDM5_9BILA
MFKPRYPDIRKPEYIGACGIHVRKLASIIAIICIVLTILSIPAAILISPWIQLPIITIFLIAYVLVLLADKMEKPGLLLIFQLIEIIFLFVMIIMPPGTFFSYDDDEYEWRYWGRDNETMTTTTATTIVRQPSHRTIDRPKSVGFKFYSLKIKMFKPRYPDIRKPEYIGACGIHVRKLASIIAIICIVLTILSIPAAILISPWIQLPIIIIFLIAYVLVLLADKMEKPGLLLIFQLIEIIFLFVMIIMPPGTFFSYDDDEYEWRYWGRDNETMTTTTATTIVRQPSHRTIDRPTHVIILLGFLLLLIVCELLGIYFWYIINRARKYMINEVITGHVQRNYTPTDRHITTKHVYNENVYDNRNPADRAYNDHAYTGNIANRNYVTAVEVEPKRIDVIRT